MTEREWATPGLSSGSSRRLPRLVPGGHSSTVEQCRLCLSLPLQTLDFYHRKAHTEAMKRTMISRIDGRTYISTVKAKA